MKFCISMCKVVANLPFKQCQIAFIVTKRRKSNLEGRQKKTKNGCIEDYPLLSTLKNVQLSEQNAILVKEFDKQTANTLDSHQIMLCGVAISQIKMVVMFGEVLISDLLSQIKLKEQSQNTQSGKDIQKRIHRCDLKGVKNQSGYIEFQMGVYTQNNAEYYHLDSNGKKKIQQNTDESCSQDDSQSIEQIFSSIVISEVNKQTRSNLPNSSELRIKQFLFCHAIKNYKNQTKLQHSALLSLQTSAKIRLLTSSFRTIPRTKFTP